MQIAIAADHGGYELKEKIKQKFEKFNWVDYGTDSPDSVDYPDVIGPLAADMSEGKIEKGIIICGTGIGAALSASRYRNVRAALCHDAYTAEMARRHNNANIIAMGARVVGDEIAYQMVDVFFNTEFEGGRHSRRVDKIEALGN